MINVRGLQHIFIQLFYFYTAGNGSSCKTKTTAWVDVTLLPHYPAKLSLHVTHVLCQMADARFMFLCDTFGMLSQTSMA